jgi:hypothetical protein
MFHRSLAASNARFPLCSIHQRKTFPCSLAFELLTC